MKLLGKPENKMVDNRTTEMNFFIRLNIHILKKKKNLYDVQNVQRKNEFYMQN